MEWVQDPPSVVSLIALMSHTGPRDELAGVWGTWVSALPHREVPGPLPSCCPIPWDSSPSPIGHGD